MNLKIPGRRVERRAFTLVEMLAVLAIMALMLLIGMPILQSFSSRGMSAAISGLMTTLRLARQYAVTKRTEVWVVFPDGRGGYANKSEIRKAAVSYAVIATNRKEKKYEYISEWKYLPKGVAFLTNTVDVDYFNVFDSYDDVDQSTVFPFPADKSPVQNLSAVLFKANGLCYSYSKDSKAWVQSNNKSPEMIAIPITSARYIEVNTNDGTVVRYSNIVGMTNLVWLQTLTGQLRIEE
jgi:prepilin-type N-terminal cleavage/methylation domain-containing protein